MMSELRSQFFIADQQIQDALKQGIQVPEVRKSLTPPPPHANIVLLVLSWSCNLIITYFLRFLIPFLSSPSSSSSNTTTTILL